MAARQTLSEVGEWIVCTVKMIVDHPDDVRLVEATGQHSVVGELRVNQEDIGKVIGKRGVHMDAIRRLTYAAAGKRRVRYLLELIED